MHLHKDNWDQILQCTAAFQQCLSGFSDLECSSRLKSKPLPPLQVSGTGFTGPNGGAVVTAGGGTYAGAGACERSSSHVLSGHQYKYLVLAMQSKYSDLTGKESLCGEHIR